MPRLPKRVPMAPWTFRITTEYENIQPIVELITDKELTSGTYVLGYETTSRDGSPADPHFHGYFESIMTQQQIRDAIRALGHSGKYSISPPKSGNFMCPTACAYCIKYGKYQTANISQELIDEWVSSNERQVEEFKNRKKEKKQSSFYKKIEEAFYDTWVAHYDKLMNATYVAGGLDENLIQQIVSDIVQYQIDNFVPIRRNTIVFMAQSFGCRISPHYRALLTLDCVNQALKFN